MLGTFFNEFLNCSLQKYLESVKTYKNRWKIHARNSEEITGNYERFLRSNFKMNSWTKEFLQKSLKKFWNNDNFEKILDKFLGESWSYIYFWTNLLKIFWWVSTFRHLQETHRRFFLKKLSKKFLKIKPAKNTEGILEIILKEFSESLKKLLRNFWKEFLVSDFPNKPNKDYTEAFSEEFLKEFM